MPKAGEIDFIKNLAPSEVKLAVDKPFSEATRGHHLIEIGTVFSLLPQPPARLLDLGCGTGWTTEFFARSGYDVLGVDIAEDMIRLAKESRDPLGLPNLRYETSDYENLSFNNEFDVAIFFDSLHHAEDEELALRRAFQALKPGGICIAKEPGKGHHDAPGSQWAIERFGTHEKDMPPEHIIELALRVGFREFRVFPHPAELSAIVFEQQNRPIPDPFTAVDFQPPLPPAPPSFMTRVARKLKRFVKNPPPPPPPIEIPWRVPMVDYLLQHLRNSGLVILRK